MNSKLMALPVLAFACLAPAFAQQGKVAIVDFQGVLAGTQDGKKAAADLQTKYLPRQKEIDGKQAELEGLKEQLQKGQNTMSDSAKQELIRKIDGQTKSVNREMEDARAEFELDQQHTVEQLAQRAKVVVDKYGRDNSYTLILDVSSPQAPVVYFSNAIDITKEIIDLYDKNSPGAAASSPAPASSAAPARPKPSAARPAIPTKPN